LTCLHLFSPEPTDQLIVLANLVGVERVVMEKGKREGTKDGVTTTTTTVTTTTTMTMTATMEASRRVCAS